MRWPWCGRSTDGGRWRRSTALPKRKPWPRSRRRYRRGDIAAGPLIEAQAAQTAAERALLRQTIAGALARIQLHVALGG